MSTSSDKPQLTLYRNGTIYSAADPFASAMLVEGDVIAWIGSEEAASSLLDDRMRVVDLGGTLVTPGFVDSHVHLTETGLALKALDLSAATSAADVLAAVGVAAAAGSAGRILGHGWDNSSWADPTLPGLEELEATAPGREVYLSRIDVHSALVSPALLAAVPEAISLPGFPLGDARIAQQAHGVLREHIRSITPEERRNAQRAALELAASRGVVAVVEMAAPQIGGVEDLRAALAWNDSDTALPQVLAYWGEAVGSAEEGRALLDSLGVPVLGLAGDLNIDGSIGSRTAALREDYTDAPGERGVLYLSAEQAAAHLIACSELGIQGGFHVIGDAALDVAVSALQEAEAAIGVSPVRRAGHRLEHAEMLDVSQVSELARFAVTLSMQPAFDALWGHDGGLYPARLGPERAVSMNPFMTLHREGVPVVFGSDSPVTPISPWDTVRAALNHSNPAERLSARAAFMDHTRAGWRAVKSSNPMDGQLVPGAAASFAIWDADQLMVQVADENVPTWSADPRARTPMLPALDGRDPRCLATVARGRELYVDPEFADRHTA